jgi:hypothetical protein
LRVFFELLGVVLFLFNHYASAIEKLRVHTDSDVQISVEQKVQELESVNRLLLEKLDDAEPSPITAGAILKAIGQILNNHQSGDRLTYSGLSKEQHRGKPFVKKVPERMIEEGLARYDDSKRSIFLL